MRTIRCLYIKRGFILTSGLRNYLLDLNFLLVAALPWIVSHSGLAMVKKYLEAAIV